MRSTNASSVRSGSRYGLARRSYPRVEHGRPLDDHEGRGETLLVAAVGARQHAMLAFLLQIGASPGAEDAKGYTALHFAAMGGAIPVVEWLLEQGFDVMTEAPAREALRPEFIDAVTEGFRRAMPLNRFIAMFIIYLVCALVIWGIFRLVSGFIDRLKLKEFDRQMGAVVGLIKGGLLCIAITFRGRRTHLSLGYRHRSSRPSHWRVL